MEIIHKEIAQFLYLFAISNAFRLEFMLTRAYKPPNNP